MGSANASQAELNAPQDVINCKFRETTKSESASNSLFQLYHTDDDSSFLPDCIAMDDAQFAVVSSIFTLGGLLGALCAGPLSTAKGRALAMRLSAIFYVLGATISTLAPSIFFLSAGRFLSGIGAGSSVVVVPIYISEVAPPSERGSFGFLTQIMTNLGILFTQILGYYLSSAMLWRLVLAVGGVIALILLFALVFVPESPAWTAANRDPHQALRILQRIRGRHTDISEEVASWDVNIRSRSPTPHLTEQTRGLLDPEDHDGRPSSRKSSASFKSSHSSANVGFFAVATNPLYSRAIVAVVGIMLVQQLTGINSVMMYSVGLMSDIFPGTSALLTIVISIVNLFSTIAASPLPDTLGRKKSLLVSCAGLGLASLGLGFSLLFNMKWLSAASVILFVAFFAMGLGPIPFLIASELVGTEAKGATQSWCLATNWIGTYLVAQFFPILNNLVNEKLGGQGYMYFVFAVFAAAGVAFISAYVPETKAKKDADEVWGRSRRMD